MFLSFHKQKGICKSIPNQSPCTPAEIVKTLSNLTVVNPVKKASPTGKMVSVVFPNLIINGLK